MTHNVIVTLTNQFHSTSTRVSIPARIMIGVEGDRNRQLQAWEYLNGMMQAPVNGRVIARIHRALCGSKTCTCGTIR